MSLNLNNEQSKWLSELAYLEIDKIGDEDNYVGMTLSELNEKAKAYVEKKNEIPWNGGLSQQDFLNTLDKI